MNGPTIEPINSPPPRKTFTFVSIGATLAAIFERESQMETNIRSLVENFVNQIVAAVEADSVRRVQQAVTAAFGGATSARRRGRPPRALAGVASGALVKRRPKQFCPVPGCTGVAAPVFGMVCSKHKDLPKAKIKEYRAARRAAKAAKK
jgi:hypothetical protein